MSQASYFTAFIVGLLGGVHCLGMCGGIITALTFGSAEQQKPWVLHAGYNLGRLISYSVIGALAGTLGYLAADLSGLQSVRIGFQLLAALMMIALGLYLGGWWQGLLRVEAAGAGLWRRIEPLGRRFIPIQSLPAAIVLGAIWGWLPCGLVYSILLWALSTANPVEGAGYLLFFGLGTLPNLLLMGVFANSFAPLIKKPAVKKAAGLIVIALACIQLVITFR